MNFKYTLFHAEHSALAETAPAGPWRGVYFDGPQPDQDHEGEEIPVWLVYVGDEEAEPVDTVYHVYSFARALALAERIAKDRQLELIHEATPA
jgi:hypothetical protein